MGDLDNAMRLVFVNEGHYSDDPADYGGPTMWGLSSRFLQGIGENRDPREISKEEAFEIYRRHFWDPIRGDELPDPLAAMLMDAVVNHGIGGGIKILQRAINYLGGALGVDGAFGPRSLAGALDAWEAFGLIFIGYILRGRQDIYDFLVKRDARQKRFERGWKNRLKRCAAFALTGEVVA